MVWYWTSILWSIDNFTITEEILVRLLANFYCQHVDRHMNEWERAIRHFVNVKKTNWCQFLIRLSCNWQWISSKHCQSSLRVHSAITLWIHSYLDNVMTKFMINNRTDAWKTDVNLLAVKTRYPWLVLCDHIMGLSLQLIKVTCFCKVTADQVPSIWLDRGLMWG